MPPQAQSNRAKQPWTENPETIGQHEPFPFIWLSRAF
jgi:hypothetical protein